MELVCAKKLEVNDSLKCKNEQLHLEYYLLSGEDRIGIFVPMAYR